MILLLKMHASGKSFDKICLKAIRNFFPGLNFLVGGYLTEGESSNFLACRETPIFPPVVGHPDLPIRKTLRRVLDPLTVMILKRVSESIFFQINKFTACKFTKEMANSLMAFNLLKIIH